MTKDEKRQYDRERYAGMAPKKRAQAKTWRAANKAESDAQRAEYRRRNRERLREIAKHYRERNKEKYRKARLASKYAVPLAKIEELDSTRLCQICSCELTRYGDDRGSARCIDHCHVTNSVRGVLCSRCNTALGLFRESSTIMTAAIGYLERSFIR